MIIAEDRLLTSPLVPFRRDQRGRINLEMPDRIISYILCRAKATHPVLAAKENPADFLRRCGKDQVLDFRQHGA